ncbi:hypothetical protein Taro_054651 [Colocasia esculenta]|uniref:Uncharacterized protein n=1 Tax=Colocasia esculenta TaxID=4460 RepID=A0A843XP30_COLES|nr:hypothetical protein [Colocasia esculenta]
MVSRRQDIGPSWSYLVVRRRLQVLRSLVTPVLVPLSCCEFIMAPRRHRVQEVAEQTPKQEARDAPPPQQIQPGLQNAHSGVLPQPPSPPQAAQGFN